MNRNKMEQRLMLMVFLVMVALASCTPVSTASKSTTKQAVKQLRYTDHVYEPNIKSVRVFPASQRSGLRLMDDVLPLNSADNFMLTFDEINADFKEYQVKYVSCNADWSPTRFNDLQFINDYNEFRINDYEYSINAKVLYTSYSISLPKVKLPGNYLVVVYRDGNPRDIIISKRVVFYTKQVRVGISPFAQRGGADRYTSHTVEFQVVHPDLELRNPVRDVKVVLRQNGRWDNAITGLKPTAIRGDKSRLEYFHFNGQNRFPSPREFRFFDIRIFRAKGSFVDQITNNEAEISVSLYEDKTRKSLAYETPLQEDFNGNYFIQNQEIGLRELESQYIKVNFFVQSPVKLEYPVYVVGAFNLWDKDQKSIMSYDATSQGYKFSTLLKQGFYNYTYVSNNQADPYPFDGARFEAENEYEVFVYYKEPTALGDRLIGYQKAVFNRR